MVGVGVELNRVRAVEPGRTIVEWGRGSVKSSRTK